MLSPKKTNKNQPETKALKRWDTLILEAHSSACPLLTSRIISLKLLRAKRTYIRCLKCQLTKAWWSRWLLMRMRQSSISWTKGKSSVIRFWVWSCISCFATWDVVLVTHMFQFTCPTIVFLIWNTSLLLKCLVYVIPRGDCFPLADCFSSSKAKKEKVTKIKSVGRAAIYKEYFV